MLKAKYLCKHQNDLSDDYTQTGEPSIIRPLTIKVLPLCLDLTADVLTTQNLWCHPSRGNKNK